MRKTIGLLMTDRLTGPLLEMQCCASFMILDLDNNWLAVADRRTDKLTCRPMDERTNRLKDPLIEMR